MHPSSFQKMTAFRDRYLGDRVGHPLRILDFGSLKVNGSYRELFAKPGWTYVGLDMAAGDNVDIVLETPYVWRGVASESADVVISGEGLTSPISSSNSVPR